MNSKVAEKERKQRLLEIYHRVDPKSTIMFNGRKFKKSDILSSSRRLMFEGVGTLQQSRGRLMQVIIVVLSDIVIFMQENNQKYYFITPENKVSRRLGSLLKQCWINFDSDRQQSLRFLALLIIGAAKLESRNQSGSICTDCGLMR